MFLKLKYVILLALSYTQRCVLDDIYTKHSDVGYKIDQC